MGIKIKNCTALTGGASRALDSYPAATLATGDRALVVSGGKFYCYTYDSTATAAENSPLIIRPDDYVSGGNWVLASSPYGDIQSQPEIVSGLAITGGISGGDVTVSANTLTITPTTCLDSGLTTKLYTSANKTCVIPSVANTDYYVFLVKLLSGGTFEFRAYTTLAGVASDAAVDKYRFVSYCRTNGSNVVMPFRQVGNTIHWTTSSAPVLTASVTGSYVSYSFASVIPSSIAETITIFAVSNGGIYVSYDGTESHSIRSDTSLYPVEIVSVSAIYLKYGTSSSIVRVRGMRIRR